jgi:ABC-2 type transport system permease protein
MTSLFPALIRRTLGQGRYVLLGCWCLLCGLQLIIVGQASAIEAQQSFGRLTELVPGFLQRGLGSRAMLLATFKGTVAFGYFHPVVVVIVALLAAYFTTEPAHEVEAGLVDLELARPVPRHAVITRSLIAGALAVGVAGVLMAAGTRIGLLVFASPRFDSPSAVVVGLLILNLTAVAALFGAIGVAIASGARRWSTAFFSTALVIVVLYLIDFLAIGWPLMRSIAWLSPFHYYPALSVVAGDAPMVRNVSILLTAAGLFALLGYWRFARRDL